MVEADLSCQVRNWNMVGSLKWTFEFFIWDFIHEPINFHWPLIDMEVILQVVISLNSFYECSKPLPEPMWTKIYVAIRRHLAKWSRSSPVMSSQRKRRGDIETISISLLHCEGKPPFTLTNGQCCGLSCFLLSWISCCTTSPVPGDLRRRDAHMASLRFVVIVDVAGYKSDATPHL